MLATTLDRHLAYALDPALLLDELGFEPVQWQRRVMRSRSRRLILNIHRQGGKSTVTAALSLWTALYHPGSLILLVSASQRQSSELFAKVTGIHRALGKPGGNVADNATTLGLENGSRVVSL